MRSILNALQDGRLFELPEAGKDRALEFLARILDANPDIEVGTDAIEAIKSRELECNTGIGLGVAVPHIRAMRDEGALFCAIGWSQGGIDYGATDGTHVHLVFMYYIPAAQKNVYLKEVSVLVKAIKKSGGMEAIEHAPDLNVVRNLLLDWVTAGLGETGPESLARMIKLEVRHAQSVPPAAPVLAIEGGKAIPRVMALSVLAAAPGAVFVLTQDAEWAAAMERENDVTRLLASGTPFVVAGRQVFVTGSQGYPGGRVLYQCVAITGAS